jgi:hypothetical protein
LSIRALTGYLKVKKKMRWSVPVKVVFLFVWGVSLFEVT